MGMVPYINTRQVGEKKTKEDEGVVVVTESEELCQRHHAIDGF